MRFLDQEGGRLSNERCMRSLQAAEKLVRAVASRAPALRSLAERARSAAEEQFARYARLERQHARALQRVHLGVVKGLLAPAEG
mmetsp:Transcript_21103/g.58485  ORF Transcript_21103/g.58485 Transcript_21103/m.58485 type:complete len:84 (+) Transcript_21103:979-1230(+)